MEYILIAVFMTSRGTTSQAMLFPSGISCEQAAKQMKGFDNASSFTREVWTQCVKRYTDPITPGVDVKSKLP